MADRGSRRNSGERRSSGERRRSEDGDRSSSRRRSSGREEEPGRARRESRSRKTTPALDEVALSDRLLSPVSRPLSRDRSLPTTPLLRGNLEGAFGGETVTDAPPREISVSVAVRCRPSEASADADAEGAISVDPARRLVSLEPPPGSSTPAQSLSASCVLPASAGQEQVFDELGLRLLETLRQGRHCTLVAYGPSGSGKSYTLLGSLAASNAAAAGGPPPASTASLSGALASPIAADGIGPSDGLAVRLGVRLLREAEDGTVRLRWLLLGGDNATCHDLLEDEGPGEAGELSEPGEHGAVPLPSREPLPPPLPLQPPEAEGEGGGGSARQLVAGAREWRCGNAAMLRRLIRAGAARQAAWATLGGEVSDDDVAVVPHAHGVLQLWSDAADAPRITMVDLAASDRVDDSVGGRDSAAQRQRVAASSSLASLGGVLQQLAAGRHTEARFKELKLTQLLQPWLAPRGALWLLAAVSAAAEQRAEAQRTLQFATLIEEAARRGDGDDAQPPGDGGDAQPAPANSAIKGGLEQMMSKLSVSMPLTGQMGVTLFREKAEKAERETAAERERTAAERERTAEAQRSLQKEQRRAKARERGYREEIEEVRSAGLAAQGSAVAVLREQLTHHENEAKAAQRAAISSEAMVRSLQMKAEHVAAERQEGLGLGLGF